MKTFTIKLKIALLLAVISVSCNTAKKNEKPNVIFVMADQWRAQAMSYAGDENIKTPNIDKLAKEDIEFTNAISSCPVCAPTRASIITGQYPLTNGIFYNDKPLKTDAVTIAKVYKENGYKTGYIGKWHLNGHKKDENIWEQRLLPTPKERRQGFEYWKVMECSHEYNNSEYYDENDIKHTWEGYDAEVQTDSAIAFINKNKNKPFFLYLSWGPPHNPYSTAPEKYRKVYADKSRIKLRPNVPDSLADKAREQLAGYYAHCLALDDYIGKLQNAIKAAGIEDNTIFIFTSDHGDMLQSHGQFAKQKPWDESIKVPFIIKYPAKLTSPKVINTPFVSVDIMPTLLGLSGLKIPNSVEGTDFSSYLLGKENIDIKSGLILCPVPFHEWSRIRGGKEYRGVRTERYTYVKDLNGPWLLFDNEEDPYQQNNLANNPEYANIQNELNEELNRQLTESNDEFKDADYYMNKWDYTYDALDTIVFKKK